MLFTWMPHPSKEGLVTPDQFMRFSCVICIMTYKKRTKRSNVFFFRGVYRGGGLLGDTRDQQEGVLT